MRFITICFMLIFAEVTDGLHIAAFNIKILGKTKMRKPHVVDYLVKVTIERLVKGYGYYYIFSLKFYSMFHVVY